MAALISLWGDADKHRKAKSLPTGDIEFAPNRRAYYGWFLLIAYLGYATLHRLLHVHGKPIDLFIAVSFGASAVLMTVSFPAKIVVDAGGLEQVGWLRKNKRIRWDDIVEINTGEKSRTVTSLPLTERRLSIGASCQTGLAS